MNWRQRTAQILKNGAGAEPAKPAEPPVPVDSASSVEVLQVLQAPTPALSSETIEAELKLLLAELSDFTEADRAEALEVALHGQFGPESWVAYLRDVLIPREEDPLNTGSAVFWKQRGR